MVRWGKGERGTVNVRCLVKSFLPLTVGVFTKSIESKSL